MLLAVDAFRRHLRVNGENVVDEFAGSFDRSSDRIRISPRVNDDEVVGLSEVSGEQVQTLRPEGERAGFVELCDGNEVVEMMLIEEFAERVEADDGSFGEYRELRDRERRGEELSVLCKSISEVLSVAFQLLSVAILTDRSGTLLAEWVGKTGCVDAVEASKFAFCVIGDADGFQFFGFHRDSLHEGYSGFSRAYSSPSARPSS